MRAKKTVVLISVGCLSVVAGVAVTRSVLFRSNPDLARVRMLVPEVSLEPSAAFSAEHDRDIMRLYNDIGRRVRWSDEDRDWVERIIGSGWPDIPVDPNGDMYESWQLFNMTLTIVGERIGNGIETDPNVASLYRETVVGMLSHPQGRVRQKGATAVALAGMLDDPALRSVLERMAATDPDPGARRAAGVKLDQYHGIKTALDGCPTCPKDGAP